MTTLRTIRTQLARNITVYLKTYNCRKDQCRRYHDAMVSFVCASTLSSVLPLMLHGNHKSSHESYQTKTQLARTAYDGGLLE